MAYSDIYEMRYSGSLMNRASAGVASEVAAGGVPGDSAVIPSWINLRAWDLAATAGWADAWASAQASGIADPGADEGVITDGMLLARLQPLLAQYPLDDLLPPPVS